MSALLTGWAGSTASGVMAELAGHSLSESSGRAKEIRAGRKTTAAELVAPLRKLQRLLRRYGVEDVGREEIETACDNWSVAFEDQGHRLPWEWRHVPRNVKEAVGTVFGGVAYIHTDPEAKKMVLGEPHALWQEFAVDYLEDVAVRLLKWGDSARGVSIVEEQYDGWLARTGRRDPYGTSSASKPVRLHSDTGRRRGHDRRVQRVGPASTPGLPASSPDTVGSHDPQ